MLNYFFKNPVLTSFYECVTHASGSACCYHCHGLGWAGCLSPNEGRAQAWLKIAHTGTEPGRHFLKKGRWCMLQTGIAQLLLLNTVPEM